MIRFLFLLLLLIGCANPVNKVTSNNYAAQCVQAEQAGDLKSAEQACYKALMNVDMGNLGDELKSERLYNLARIKRQLGKFAEAENLLKASLEIESKLSSPSDPKIGRRCAELSMNLAALNKWDEGVSFVKRLIPIIDRYKSSEKQFIKQIFLKYSENQMDTGNIKIANDFKKNAKRL